MHPIHEIKKNNAKGYALKDFNSKFLEICNEHTENNKAKSFAFIFWDFRDEELKDILDTSYLPSEKFTRLNTLSGDKLSIFYLQGSDKRLFNKFNKDFFKKLDLNYDGKKPPFPFIVFFKIRKGKITDITSVELRKDKIFDSFTDLHHYIKDYIKGEEKKSEYPYIKIITKIGLQVSTDFIFATLL